MKSFALLLATGTLFFISSCTNCVNCAKNNTSERLCESSYSSTETYEAEVNTREAQGFVCTAE